MRSSRIVFTFWFLFCLTPLTAFGQRETKPAQPAAASSGEAALRSRIAELERQNSLLQVKLDVANALLANSRLQEAQLAAQSSKEQAQTSIERAKKALHLGENMQWDFYRNDFVPTAGDEGTNRLAAPPTPPKPTAPAIPPTQ